MSSEHEHSHEEHEDALAKFEEVKYVRPSRNGEFVGQEGDNFYVALSEEEVYALSPLAYYIWSMCDGEHNVEDLAGKMSQDLNVNIDEAKEVLAIALTRMSEVDLIHLLK